VSITRAPAPAVQGLKVFEPVTAQPLNTRKKFGIGPAAVEQSDLVTASQRSFDQGAAQEDRPPKD
jgi:hypothetical protein